MAKNVFTVRKKIVFLCAPEKKSLFLRQRTAFLFLCARLLKNIFIVEFSTWKTNWNKSDLYFFGSLLAFYFYNSFLYIFSRFKFFFKQLER